MRTFQLRTYRLQTEEAAIAYLPHWKLHIESLKLFGVETHAFFSAPSTPRNVVALLSFGEHDEPEEVTREYMQSEAFKHDMTGFDVTQIVFNRLFSPLLGSSRCKKKLVQGFWRHGRLHAEY